MLTSKSSENQKGILIIGDYYDLKNLHDTIHGITYEGVYGEEILLSFAYDIRKAFYGNKGKEVYLIDGNTYTSLYVEIPWPIAICAANILRELAGYTNTSKEIQSNLYRLEFIIESVLKYETASMSYDLIKWVNRFKLPPAEYLSHLIYYIVYKDLKFDENKDRFLQLKENLDLLNPYNAAHKDFVATLENEAKNLGCTVKSLNIDYDKLGLRW